MGQEIVYCFKCQRRIVGAEFAKGHAFQVGNHITCATCAVDLLNTLGAGDREQLLAKMFKATQERQSSSSGSLSAAKASPPTSRTLKQSTARLPAAPMAAPRSAPPLLPIAIGAAVLVAIVLGVALTGSPPEKPPPLKAASSEDAAVRRPAPPALSSTEKVAHEAAQGAVRKAREFSAKAPRDLEGQIGIWRETLDLAAGTPYSAEAKREFDALIARRQETIPKEWSELEAKAQAQVAAQHYQAAIDVLQAARMRYSLPEWTQPVDRRIGEIYQAFARAAAPTKEAPQVNVPAPVVAVKKPEPPALSAAETAALAKWEAALGRATARDYAAALEELKSGAAADLEAVRSAAALLQETQELLAKWPRGQLLTVEVFGSGGPELVEGVMLRGDGTRLTLKQTAGTVGLQIGEITPASLAERFRTRAAKKPELDDRAAALFCLLEGDDEAARKILGGKTDTIPDRYWRYAAKVASLRQSSEVAAKESEARNLFRSSEEGLLDYSKMGPSVECCRMLLRDFGATAFVARNRAAIASRAAGGNEYLFCADTLKPVGAWKSARSSKGDPCWTCEKDGEPGRTPATVVDLTFTAFPNTEYRCWVYVGACCQETFTFFVQGTEMTVSNPKVSKEPQPVEPGGAAGAPVKLSLVGLKKTHSLHNGPKTPAQWAWIPIPLPKYASAGVKIVRLLTDQQGFSIAYAAVTTQKEPPRDAEMKDFERAVKDAAGPSPKPAAVPVVARSGKSVCAEDFSKGKGRFASAGEIVDAGAGVKALAIPPKGATVGGFSVVTKPSTTVRFRVKALIDLDIFECLTWVSAKNANAWFHVNDLKKGEWRTVEIRLGDMMVNYQGAPIMGETVDGLLFYYLNRPDDARVLITDFEIRD